MKNINLKYALGLPPDKAVEYFRSKGYTFSWDWWEVWQQAHAKAFTVAKAMQMDVLQDIREMVDRAIEEGLTFRQFRAELEPRLKAKGWWGKVWAVDEQGRARRIQLGSPWRLKTIYRTNIQTAFMAGRYKAQLDNAEARPWWQYVAVLDAKTRPSHRAMHGKVFRYDDPFWDHFYPPNGWNCRCRVRALSNAALRRRGITPESSKGKIRTEDQLLSPRTGEVRPSAVYEDPRTGTRLVTDPGWNYNPGKSAWQPDLDAYPYDVAKQYIQGAITGPDFLRFFEGKVEGNYPVAVLNEEYRRRIGAQAQYVRLSTESLRKNLTEHPDVSIRDYQQLPDIIENAQLIIQDRTYTLVFIKRNGKIYHAVIKATRDGKELYLTSFRFTNPEDIKRMRKKGNIVKDEL